MNITCFVPDGRHTTLSVDDKMLVSDLSALLNQHFSWNGCRVVFQTKKLSLEDKVVDKLKNDDVVVVIPQRDVNLKQHTIVGKPVTMDEIKEATKGKGNDDEVVTKKNDEVATEVSQRIHGFMTNLFGPRDNAEGEEEENEEQNEEEEGELSIPEVTQQSLDLLTGMGFTENAAKKALILCNGNTERAMDWILEHDGPTLNDEITQEELRSVRGRGRAGGGGGVFKVDQDIANRLQEMGFSAQQVGEALRITRNNEQAAVSFLLGEGGGGGNEEDDSDDENGIGMNILENPVLRALLMHPGIQEGLRNPRVLEAFRAILVDPASAQNYLNDPEIAPVLLQVNNILHQADGEEDNNNE